MLRTPVTALIFVLAACGPVTFGTEVTGESVIVGNSQQPPLTVLPSIGGFNDLDFNTTQEFQSQKVTRTTVTNIAVESATLRIVSPVDQSFAFLQNVQLVARAGDSEVVFAEKVDIASLELPLPNPTLDLDLRSVNLTPFFTAPIVTVLLRGKGTQPAKDARIEVKLKFRVSASP